MQLPFRAARVAVFSLLGLLPASLYAQMGSPYGYGSPYSAPPQPYAQSPYGYGQPQSYGYSQQGYGAPQGYSQPSYNQPQGYARQSYPQQAYDQPQYGTAQPGYTQPSYAQPYAGQQTQQGLNADQLEQMVAPIALYPDTLVAQVLAASTYPQQVAQADQWLSAQGNASPYQIAGGADVQQWDPSVKALTAFPQVLAEIDRNQGWMSALGNAYYNQPQDVMQAIQVMRQRAQAAGTLQSTPQEQMTYDQGNIELAPPSPDEVYVPQYDPWNSYGDAVTPYPGFSLLGAIGSFFGSTIGPGLLHFGPGIAMAAFNHTPFGWVSWALSWLTDGISFGQSTWGTHSTAVADWGLPYGGPRFALGVRAGYHGSAFGYRGVGVGGPVRGQGYARSNSYPSRGYESPDRTGYRRGPEAAYNRAPVARAESSFGNRAPAYSYSRQQTADRPENHLAYGPEVYNNGGMQRGFAPTQQRQSYAAPAQAYRGPSEGFGRNGFDGRSGSSFQSSGSYRSQQSFQSPKQSGGFHLFGGGSSSHEFKQPKMEYKAPKAPKMSSHSFGGGGHSSSHSSGGHSSGHHHW